MLRDITIKTSRPSIFFEGASERLAEGVYHTGFNFNYDLKNYGYKINEYPFQDLELWHKFMNMDASPERDEIQERLFNGPEDYGVCDNWEQIVDLWPEILTSEREFIISVTLIEQDPDNRGGGGGWRWHKWGKYIGNFDHQCEYLDDEVGIDHVWTFHIIEILGEN